MADPPADDAATANTNRSLLDLPPEIWSEICRLAATPSGGEVILRVPSFGAWHTTTHRTKTSMRQPNITRTCRIIRQETLPSFYRQTTFVLKAHGNLIKPNLYPVADQLFGYVGRKHWKDLRLSYECSPKQARALYDIALQPEQALQHSRSYFPHKTRLQIDPEKLWKRYKIP